jgi:hypothetical protein
METDSGPFTIDKNRTASQFCEDVEESSDFAMLSIENDHEAYRAFRFHFIGIAITDMLLGLVAAAGFLSEFMRRNIHISNAEIHQNQAGGGGSRSVLA